MEILIVALIIGLIPALIAKSKGRDFIVWYIYSAALFIVALIYSLVISKTAEKVNEDLKESGYVECPFCKEYIKPNATVCPHCQRDVPPTEDKGWEEYLKGANKGGNK